MSLSQLTKELQRKVGVRVDGIYGPQTARAALESLGGEPDLDTSKPFPNQALVRSGNSEFGLPGKNLTIVSLPYPMRLAWDKATVVTRISVNKACSSSAMRIFYDTLQAYGEDRIRALGLDLFGGCFNNRSIRGGTAKSIHAWGAAIDLDPENNSLHADHTQARFAHPDYNKFWEVVDKHGWTSLGKERDYDWMHIQAPSL